MILAKTFVAAHAAESIIKMRPLAFPVHLVTLRGCAFSDWHAGLSRLSEISASQNVALRFPDLPGGALQFPDPTSAFQTGALRFADLSTSQTIALQFLKNFRGWHSPEPRRRAALFGTARPS